METEKNIESETETKIEIGKEWIMLLKKMLCSAAWQNLTGKAISFYLALIQDLIRPEQTDKPDECNIENLFIEFDNLYNIKKYKSYKAASVELIEKGFIEYKRRDGWKNKIMVFRLSNNWQYSGTPDISNGQSAPDGLNNNWAFIPRGLLKSKLFKRLSTTAMKLYFFMIKDIENFRRSFNFENKTRAEIIIKCADIENILAANTYRRARAELIKTGFIEFIEYRGLRRTEAVYLLSDKWISMDRQRIEAERLENNNNYNLANQPQGYISNYQI